MNELNLSFAFDSNAIRVSGTPEEPLFVAADVCNALEHTNTSMAIKSLDEDEKGVSKVYTPGGEQEMSVVNEAGLYKLIFKSRKEEAKVFQRWVTHEVLPSIRKTGQYKVDGLKKELEEKNKDIKSAYRGIVHLFADKILGESVDDFVDCRWAWLMWRQFGSYAKAGRNAQPKVSSGFISRRAKKYEHFLDASAYYRRVTGLMWYANDPLDILRIHEDYLSKYGHPYTALKKLLAIKDISVIYAREAE